MTTLPSEILEKQFFAMTGSEILQLVGIIAESKAVTQDYTAEKYVYGLNGLAKLLGCGKTNASKIKGSGILDKAIYQSGRKIVIDSEKALELLAESAGKK